MDGVSSPDSRDGDAPGDEIGDRNVDGDGVDHLSTDIAVTVSAAAVIVAITVVLVIILASVVSWFDAAVTAGLISIGLPAMTAKFGAELALISSTIIGGITATIGGVLANARVIAASICAAVGTEANVNLGVAGIVTVASNCIVTTGEAVVTAITPGISGISG